MQARQRDDSLHPFLPPPSPSSFIPSVSLTRFPPSLPSHFLSPSSSLHPKSPSLPPSVTHPPTPNPTLSVETHPQSRSWGSPSSAQPLPKVSRWAPPLAGLPRPSADCGLRSAGLGPLLAPAPLKRYRRVGVDSNSPCHRRTDVGIGRYPASGIGSEGSRRLDGKHDASRLQITRLYPRVCAAGGAGLLNRLGASPIL